MLCDGWTYLREPTQTTFGHGPQSEKTWELMITFGEPLSSNLEPSRMGVLMFAVGEGSNLVGRGV